MHVLNFRYLFIHKLMGLWENGNRLISCGKCWNVTTRKPDRGDGHKLKGRWYRITLLKWIVQWV